jgi:hypothetical protein
MARAQLAPSSHQALRRNTASSSRASRAGRSAADIIRAGRLQLDVVLLTPYPVQASQPLVRWRLLFRDDQSGTEVCLAVDNLGDLERPFH